MPPGRGTTVGSLCARYGSGSYTTHTGRANHLSVTAPHDGLHPVQAVACIGPPFGGLRPGGFGGGTHVVCRYRREDGFIPPPAGTGMMSCTSSGSWWLPDGRRGIEPRGTRRRLSHESYTATMLCKIATVAGIMTNHSLAGPACQRERNETNGSLLTIVLLDRDRAPASYTSARARLYNGN